MSEKSVANALITRTMDFEKQYEYSYSKIVGLQSGNLGSYRKIILH
jgi:hypothetical protein